MVKLKGNELKNRIVKNKLFIQMLLFKVMEIYPVTSECLTQSDMYRHFFKAVAISRNLLPQTRRMRISRSYRQKF